MEFSTPSDNLGSTSTPEAGSSPIPAEVSTPSTEASGAGNAPITGTQLPSGDSQAPSTEIDFPDDAAFQALTPESRRSNWQQLRDQYAETKRRVGELSALEAHQPVIQRLEERGGYERLSSLAELAESLFSPLLDENDQHMHRDGMPQYTAEPFVERLHTESPSTFGEVMERGFDMPNPDNPAETVGHWFVRERLGLNPDLIETYRQITSPQDGMRFAPHSIAPDELANIPAQYHEVYKTFSPAQREELGLITNPDALNAFLSDKQELYENRKFRDEQREFQAAQKQKEQEAFNTRVSQESERIIGSVRDASINAAREKLGREATFSAEAEVNGAVWEEILTHAQNAVMADPVLAKDNATCERLYRLSALYDAQGDRFKSHEARVQADRLATKLTGRFNNAVIARTAFWSKALGQARSSSQQQIQNLQPRAEIGGGSAPRPQTDKRVLTAPNGEGFGFSRERLDQIKADAAQRRAAQ